MTRWTIRISICLLLGVILNVAVAVIAASAWPANEGHAHNEDWINDGQSELARYTVIVMQTPASERYVFESRVGLNARPVEELRNILPQWAIKTFKEIRETERGQKKWIDVIGAGWPMIALTGSVRMNSGTKSHDVETVLVIGASQRYWDQRLVPYRPLAPGFLINTLFYALICFALLFAPGTIRRRIRAARGRCIKCGYDLRGSPAGECPECGWGRSEVS